MNEARDHFVYTAYNSAGRVLYVGCTRDLDGRRKAHQWGSDWYPLAARFQIRGPYSYQVGRQVEREYLLLERPLYGMHPKRRTYGAIYNRVYKREHAWLISQGREYWDALKEALAFAKEVIPGGDNNREPLDVTDELLRAAFLAERHHVERLEQMAGAA